jgi:hypothetical protein
MREGKPEVAVFPRTHQDAVIPPKGDTRFFQCNNIINQQISAFTEMTIRVLPEGFRPLLQNRSLLPMQFSGLSLILFRMKWYGLEVRRSRRSMEKPVQRFVKDL